MSTHKLTILIIAGLVACNIDAAVEEYSNGRGGGEWSDPATWRSSKVPSPEATVVIGRDDVVLFDRNDVDRVTCRELYIDKKGMLSFKMKTGPIRAAIGGFIETYGTIRLDGTARRDDRIELHMVGSDPAKRTISLKEGGSLTVIGRTDTDDGKPNAIISSIRDDKRVQYDSAHIVAQRGSGLDLTRAHVINVAITAHGLDNTGAEFNERLNVTESLFTDNSHISMYGCDTPLIANNRFERNNEHTFFGGAIAMNGCSLPDIHNNEIIGRYQLAIFALQMNDGAVVSNIIDGAGVGLHWDGMHVMIQDMTIRNCDSAIQLSDRAAGAIDGLVTEGCKEVLDYQGFVQISNWITPSPPTDTSMISCRHGALELLNTSIEPEQTRREPEYEVLHHGQPYYDRWVRDGVPARPMIQASCYLVVGLNGDVPPNARIEVRTANPAQPIAAGAIDPNVRNSPALVGPNNLTPLPGSLTALIVKAWRTGQDGVVVKTPTYTVSVQVPGAEDGSYTTVQTIDVTPDSSWLRPALDDVTPTVTFTFP
jgi:hypothetical protein